MVNQAKTFILIVALTGLLVWIGDTLYGQTGLVIALVMGLVMNAAAYFFSDQIVLMSSGARIVSPEEAPELHAIVATLAQRAGLPMPRVALVPDEAPNAFATGRDPEHAVVACTEGILRLMTRPQLEAVLAHELGHVKHRDILLSSLAAVLAQAIMFLSHMATWVTPRDEEGRPHPLAGLLVAIFGPIAAMLLQMALSRSREYLADDYSAHLTGRPDLLADALERLHAGNAAVPSRSAQPATAQLMIINPFSGLFSTHPPIQARIERLRRMPVEMR